MSRVHAFAAAAILLACQPAAAADVKDFRDWHAACDNLRDCNAYGFDASLSGAAYLRIERGGAPNAPVTRCPRARATAPVNVATSTRWVAPSRSA